MTTFFLCWIHVATQTHTQHQFGMYILQCSGFSFHTNHSWDHTTSACTGSHQRCPYKPFVRPHHECMYWLPSEMPIQTIHETTPRVHVLAPIRDAHNNCVCSPQDQVSIHRWHHLNHMPSLWIKPAAWLPFLYEIAVPTFWSPQLMGLVLAKTCPVQWATSARPVFFFGGDVIHNCTGYCCWPGSNS